MSFFCFALSGSIRSLESRSLHIACRSTAPQRARLSQPAEGFRGLASESPYPTMPYFQKPESALKRAQGPSAAAGCPPGRRAACWTFSPFRIAAPRACRLWLPLVMPWCGAAGGPAVIALGARTSPHRAGRPRVPVPRCRVLGVTVPRSNCTETEGCRWRRASPPS